MGVIFISHKLGEVLDVTNRITIMRHGRVVAERANDGALSKPELARLMCGRELMPPQKPAVDAGRAAARARPRLDRRRRARALEDVSLTLHAGEIVGIAGVSGNGQRELADLVAGVLAAGARHASRSPARIVADPSPKRMQALKIGRVPEDRLTTGMIGACRCRNRWRCPWIDAPPFSRRGMLNRGAIRRFATDQIERFDIRTSGPEARTGTLSGGNLQKALLARETRARPENPARGAADARHRCRRDGVHPRRSSWRFAQRRRGAADQRGPGGDVRRSPTASR